VTEISREKANLREADLCGADLCEANLRRADLYKTNLRRADLHNADLRRADLYNADLRETELRAANLAGTIGIIDGGQRLEDGYRFVAHKGSNGWRILAGCRGPFTVEQAIHYWSTHKRGATHPLTLDSIRRAQMLSAAIEAAEAMENPL